MRGHKNGTRERFFALASHARRFYSIHTRQFYLSKRCEDIRTELENVFLILHLFCQPGPNRQENCPFIFLLYLMLDNFTLYTQDNFTCLGETPLAWGLNATFYTV